MNNYYAIIMRKTQKIVKAFGMTQGDHWYYIYRNYVNLNTNEQGRYPGTISRRLTGKILLPWKQITHYAGYGTRCPAALVDDLSEYIADFFYSRALQDALRAVIMEVLFMLPPEDQEDICDYWDSSNLAHMWATIQWYIMTCDYAATTWSA